MALKNVQPRDLSTLRPYEELKDEMTREEYDESTKLFDLHPLEGFGEGVYNNWQLEHNTSTPLVWDTDLRSLVAENDWFNCYGVCDSPQQFFDMYGEALRNSDRWFCTNFSVMRKSEQPELGVGGGISGGRTSVQARLLASISTMNQPLKRSGFTMSTKCLAPLTRNLKSCIMRCEKNRRQKKQH